MGVVVGTIAGTLVGLVVVVFVGAIVDVCVRVAVLDTAGTVVVGLSALVTTAVAVIVCVVVSASIVVVIGKVGPAATSSGMSTKLLRMAVLVSAKSVRRAGLTPKPIIKRSVSRLMARNCTRNWVPPKSAASISCVASASEAVSCAVSSPGWMTMARKRVVSAKYSSSPAGADSAGARRSTMTQAAEFGSSKKMALPWLVRAQPVGMSSSNPMFSSRSVRRIIGGRGAISLTGVGVVSISGAFGVTAAVMLLGEEASPGKMLAA